MLVVPDVLANAGGVVVSYFEWVQGLQELFWTEGEVNERLREIVGSAFRETWDLHEARGVSLRTAAYGLAVRRVAEASTIRGLYPLAETVTLIRGARLPPVRAGTRGARGACAAELGFEVDEVDITGVPELERAYREWIPVVEVDGERVSVYRVEAGAAASQTRRSLTTL